MALMPMFIVRLGVKRLLAAGHVGLGGPIRMLWDAPSCPSPSWEFFCTVSVTTFSSWAARSMLITKLMWRIAREPRAFLAFVTLGLGMFIGAPVLAGLITRLLYPPLIQVPVVTCRWNTGAR